MKEASFYTKQDGRIQCSLCPYNCLIAEGKYGSCKVRRNENGKLYSINYEQVCSLHFDPIEKKPLYHFFPGKTIFSVGSVGCNLHCEFCQNWEISQSGVEEFGYLKTASPQNIVDLARERQDNFGIAYTYNEPTVWYEYMFEIAKTASTSGLKNVMVTNGFINPEPLDQLLPYMDAFSVDLKAFNEEFYKKFTSSKLEPVLNTLKKIKQSDRHFEITNLLITGTNDNPKEFKQMIDWISKELGQDTVLHISRYFPTYKMTNPPTSEKTLHKFYDIATEKLNYVYLGNVRSGTGQDTFCKNCKTKVIERSGYYTDVTSLTDKGTCNNCGEQIISPNCI